MPGGRSSFVTTTPAELAGAFRRRVVVAQSLYAVGALIGLVSVPLGITLIILIQLNYAFAPRLPILRALTRHRSW